VATAAADLRDRVLATVEAQRDELVAALSRAIQIESVNPKYPGQVYDEVVGREGEMARFMADLYRGAGCEIDLFAVEPRAARTPSGF
jgi:acetylornithine deacetylase